MQYRRLGKAGIKLSELSFGSWLTFGGQLDLTAAKNLMKTAYDAGINFFDNAEAYAGGESERLMGQVLREWHREDYVVSTKIFWGGKGPNDKGLSRKHLIEGTNKALKRLGLEYVDLLFAHRPDPETPIEETVRAMDHLIHQGKALYWGTSEWSAAELEEAFRIARELNLTPPTMEQPQYHLLHSHRVELEYVPLIKQYGLGLTTWSPLASGILTGKYNDGIPKDSRLARVQWLATELTPARLAAVRELSAIALELEVQPAQLAIAWCLKNPDVSTVILGASTHAQLKENLGALRVLPLLTGEVMARISRAQAQAAG